jgi:hypothetical protein
LPPASPFAVDFLNLEWPLLLECCSLPLNSAKISALVGNPLSSESLLRLADDHGVLAHLAAAFAKVPDGRISAALLDALRSRHRRQVVFTLGMTAELLRVLQLLRQSGIGALAVKGPALSVRAFGDPAIRRFADLDLLVRQEHIALAAKSLCAAGYQSRIKPESIRAGRIPGEYFFWRPHTRIKLELHTELTFRHFPRPIPLESYFLRQTSLFLDGYAVPVLSAEHEFLLLAVHGAKDFWARLMWISDVAAMVHNDTGLDWSILRESAAEVGATRMLRMALLLSERMLGVRVPDQMSQEVASDSNCARLVAQIETWLPYAGYVIPSVAERALFRFRIGESAMAGARYLARLLFSPNEEDWSADDGIASSGLAQALRRPFRLAKKYRRPEP